MSTMTLSAKGGGDFFRLRFWAAGLLMLGICLMLGTGQAYALTLAGTSIGNQASATYNDNGGIARVTVSNTVTTTVNQVSSATLASSQTKNGAPGQPITFPHSITNNGNGPETYTLSTGVVTAGTTLSSVPLLYPDANCDGVADSATTITSVGPAAPGTTVCFVAQGTLTAVATTPSSFNVTAVSQFTLLQITNSPNLDVATISTAAVIGVTKSVNLASGPSGTIVTYTLTYRNTGTQTASGLVLVDQLQSGVSVTAGSIVTWSGGPTGAINSGTVVGSTPNRINVALDTASGTTQRVVAVIESVPANTQGTFSYTALETGPGPINNNTAQACYNDGPNLTGAYQPGPAGVQTACTNIIGTTGATTGSGVLSSNSTQSASYNTNGGILDTNVPTVATSTVVTNTVPFNITTATIVGSVVINDGTNSGSALGDGVAVAGSNPVTAGPYVTPAAVPAPPTNNASINVVPSANQGAVVTFNNWVWNTGTGSDTFNITVVTGGLGGTPQYPTGTTFLLFKSDGITPLTDTDGNGVLDTGPVPGGAGMPCNAGSPNPTSGGGSITPCGYLVVVRAILPTPAAPPARTTSSSRPPPAPPRPRRATFPTRSPRSIRPRWT